ncbi:hypothetical protein [Nostoc sp.]
MNVVAGISDRLNFFMKVNFQQLQGNNKGKEMALSPSTNVLQIKLFLGCGTSQKWQLLPA